LAGTKNCISKEELAALAKVDAVAYALTVWIILIEFKRASRFAAAYRPITEAGLSFTSKRLNHS
jgi:hypothetical protein